MLRLRTLFLCPSNTRSKNQQWRKKRRIFKKNSQVVFPSPFPFPEFSGRVLSQDSRRWRSSNKSADVHLTVNADAVRLVTSVQCPGHSHCCQGLSVSSGLRSVCTSSHFVWGAPCWTHYPHSVQPGDISKNISKLLMHGTGVKIWYE